MTDDETDAFGDLPPVLRGGPVQVAYGVTDVRAAASTWVEAGAGPFFVRDHIPVTDVIVDGVAGRFDHSSAYGQWGALMVELVCVHDPPQLARLGLHHMAWMVDSHTGAASALTEVGMAPRLEATAGATRFSMHDGGARLGHLVEIYERSDALVGFYDMVRTVSIGWDGADPIRTV